MAGKAWGMVAAVGLLAGCGGPGAGETLVEETQATQSYIAKVPLGWTLSDDELTSFTFQGGRASVIVTWEPSEAFKSGFLGESETYRSGFIDPLFDAGGEQIEFNGFSGVFYEKRTEDEGIAKLLGKHFLSISAEKGESFMLINVHDNYEAITREQLIDFAKSIRMP